MGANVKKRKQLRKKSKNAGKLLFKCYATKRSWKKGTNVEKNYKEIGIVFDPNNVRQARQKRLDKLRAMYHSSNENKDDPSKNNDDAANSTSNQNQKDFFDYHPRDLDTFVENEQKQTPLGLKLPKSMLTEQLNLALNTEPANLFNSLPRHRREYYQRLINKYGRDYRAMQRDTKLNFFQFTAARLRKDIQHFRYEFRFTRIAKTVKL